jgi:hypothetical protein
MIAGVRGREPPADVLSPTGQMIAGVRGREPPAAITPPVARLALVLALALVLSACGGDDGDPQQAVRDFVEATNARDGDRLCGELLTQEYLEKATGATGDNAEEACKSQLDLIKGLKLKLISVDEPKVDGDSATVRATIATGGQRAPRVFELAKEDGSWKLVGATGS